MKLIIYPSEYETKEPLNIYCVHIFTILSLIHNMAEYFL